ncbi:hypothetical membrane protein, conserved [Thermococcus onnurineus NA1]|uniref:Hypothetical membrane protein, conserved n=1 Tax=Thermococcus onnurineus (strain NA1) TaxID=523850 RepID=B6YTE2_THEON|nr:membrane protein [Thermococcus onnurineus]ACJ15829.1 hypothetical membrane protein, conserved [Thermococcus onnurineus NA1]
MKKAAALILLGLMIFSFAPMAHLVKSATVPEYASITGISLGLKDKAVLGPFEVQFIDVDMYWSRLSFQVNGPDGPKLYVVGQGESFVYPAADNQYLNITLTWIRSDTKTALIEIQSPLQKLLSGQKLNVGDTINLPEGFPQISIKLTSTSDTQATFLVTLPYGETQTLVITEGSGGSVRYKLGDVYSYSNYVYIHLLNTTSDGPATVDIYVPKVASTDFKIVREGEEETAPTTTVETVLVYNDLLYVNEKLPITVDNVTYYVKLISATRGAITVEVFKGDQSLGSMILEIGDFPKDVPNAPLKLSVQSAEPDYKRAIIRVYAPIGAQVTPILRQANVIAMIDAVPKEIMLGDNLVVAINVENLGRGDAYDVSVAAPIPNDFELVSMTKTWAFETLPAFTKMPALIYVLKPTKVGEFDIGKVIVTFYDDKSLETGQERVIYSQPLTGIKVYGIPAIDVTAQAYNGTWGSYVTANVGDNVTVRFILTAADGNPDYEFVQNATLLLDLPNSVDGPTAVEVGTIKAGETKTVRVDFKVLKENLTNVKAVLVYADPLGNEHQLELGNLVTINSIPPRVIVKEVPVYPGPEELPKYINQTLANMSDPAPVAKEISAVVEKYNPTTNYWKVLGILFLILALVFGGLTYKYWDESEKLREKLERKKHRRPGGLPKKAEEEERESSEMVEL